MPRARSRLIASPSPVPPRRGAQRASDLHERLEDRVAAGRPGCRCRCRARAMRHVAPRRPSHGERRRVAAARGVNLTAFDSRLSRICCSFSASARTAQPRRRTARRVERSPLRAQLRRDQRLRRRARAPRPTRHRRRASYSMRPGLELRLRSSSCVDERRAGARWLRWMRPSACALRVGHRAVQPHREQLRVAGDRVQRRAQLVADSARKSSLARLGRGRLGARRLGLAQRRPQLDLGHHRRGEIGERRQLVVGPAARHVVDHAEAAEDDAVGRGERDPSVGHGAESREARLSRTSGCRRASSITSG